jgi:hypothetical protein
MAQRASSDSDANGAPLTQLVALAVWLGAALFFAAVVARAAFDVLPSRELAGALVGRVLPVVFLSGLVVGIGVLVLDLIGPRRSFALPRMIGGAVIVVACAIAQLGIAPRIAALRAALPAPLAELAADDPARLAFGRLHFLSVAWLGVAMVAGIVAMILAAIALRNGAPSAGRS